MFKFRFWSYLKNKDVKRIERHEQTIVELGRDFSNIMGEVSTLRRALSDHIEKTEKKSNKETVQPITDSLSTKEKRRRIKKILKVVVKENIKKPTKAKKKTKTKGDKTNG